MKISERLKNVEDIEKDHDFCRLIILEMKRDYDGYDYFQCSNELDYKCLVNYFDLVIDDKVKSYPVSVRIKFVHNKGVRKLTSSLMYDKEYE